MLSKAIADALEKADPDHKDIYQENASAYSEKLKDLDAKYQEVVDGASQKTEIIVQGTFETYKEPNDETLYCRITDADMQIKK